MLSYSTGVVVVKPSYPRKEKQMNIPQKLRRARRVKVLCLYETSDGQLHNTYGRAIRRQRILNDEIRVERFVRKNGHKIMMRDEVEDMLCGRGNKLLKCRGIYPTCTFRA